MEQDRHNVRGRAPQSANVRFSPERLKAAMDRGGVSAADLARALREEYGIVGANLSAYLQPGGPRPGPEMLLGLTTILECSLLDLMDEIGENGGAP